MTKLVVIVGFLVAFGAGLAVGIKSRHAALPLTTRPSHHSGWLSAELNLTPQQQEQLKAIWSETMQRGGHEREEQRRPLRRQRDEGVAALIRPEDKPRYDKILEDYSEQTNALDGEWRSSYQAAVERTKQILTPQQRTKYEELLQRHESERGSHERHRGEREHGIGWRGDDHATSRPGSQP